jgi:hypothetical protein
MFAWAQSRVPQSPAQQSPGQQPPVQQPLVQLQHGGVYPGARPSAPAMSAKDVPPAVGVPNQTFAAPNGNLVHTMLTAQGAAARRAAIGLDNPGGPLVYHANGQIMNPGVVVYAIFWAPPHLQTGAATGFSANYGLPTLISTAWLQSHGLMNIATQYYQTISGTTTYFQNMGGLQAFVVDTGALPASGCTDTATPGNCVSDAQLQAKIQAVMTAQGWTGGINKIFVIFTSSGEGSCAGSSCAYTQYCAYHSSFSFGGQSVLYANIPYGNPSGCQAGGQTTPNDAAGDLAANVTTHEIMETATDPFINAWFGSLGGGSEIGDLCNFIFGTNTWGTGAGAGNQMWNGIIMEVQEEYDNHAYTLSGNTSGCVQVGPQ